MSGFEDIRITGFDEKATRPSGERALEDLVLTLSATPPSAWATNFDTLWQQAFYMTKRHAWVSGKTIVVRGMPNELQEHIGELNKVLSQLNEHHRQFDAEQTAERARRKVADDERAAELAKLKSTLKFE